MYTSSPGPKYNLPSSLGFDGHDPTMPRAPALTIAPGRRTSTKSGVPGPKYDCRNKSHRGGGFTSQEYSLLGKPKFSYPRVPGAHSYGAHLCPDTVHERPPSWPILGRFREDPPTAGPAPKYKLKDLIGQQAPELSTPPAYSILGRQKWKAPKFASPGPGRYACVPADFYLKKPPTAIILSRHEPSLRGMRTSPAPKYQSDFVEGRCPPAYSFGVRHSPRQRILYTKEDRQPFHAL